MFCLAFVRWWNKSYGEFDGEFGDFSKLDSPDIDDSPESLFVFLGERWPAMR